MSDTDRSAAHQTYFEAAQKFDYFVTGGAGTALTYAVQTYQPVAGEVFRPLVPTSWLLLLAAVASGLWHLSMRVDVARISVAHSAIGDDLNALREAQIKGVGAYVPGADVLVPPQHMADAIKMHATEVERIQEWMAKLNSRGKWASRLRNAFLFLGLAALTAWKILNLR